MQEVKRGAFSCEQSTGLALYLDEFIVCGDKGSVFNLGVKGDVPIETRENGAGDFDAGDDALLAGDDPGLIFGGCLYGRGCAQICVDIYGAEVF